MIARAREAIGSSFLLAAASAYALLCAVLLIGNLYLGIVAALAPGLAVFFSQTRISPAVMARRAGIAWILLLVAVLPWQSVTVTSTGLESVGPVATIAKLILTGIAVTLAFLAGARGLTYRWPLRALLAYAVVAAIGGFTTADPFPSLLRSGRLILILLATAWVASRLPRPRLAALFTQFAVAISLLALFGRAMGLVSPHLYGGRLAGYLPPLHPNLVGMLAAGGLLCAAALLSQRRLSPWPFTMTTVILGLTLVLSQSRASMVALVIGLLALGCTRLTTRSLLIVGLVTGAFVAAALVQANTESQPVTALLTHNGNTTTTSTLNSRLSEWDAVLKRNDTTVARAVGQGSATKTVNVSMNWTQYASVDGTWPAAYLSAGLIGALILAAAVIGTVFAAIERRDEFAMMIVVFLITSSLVTNIFNDLSIGLVLFVATGAGTFVASQRTVAGGDRMRSRRYSGD